MKYLSSRQINEYQKNGYVLIKNVFPKKICNKYKKLLKIEIEKGKKLLKKYEKRKISHNANKIGDVPRGIHEGILQDIAHRNSKFMSVAKDKRLVNWDPKLLTAISDLEVEQKEQEGFLWHIKYPINKDKYIISI